MVVLDDVAFVHGRIQSHLQTILFVASMNVGRPIRTYELKLTVIVKKRAELSIARWVDAKSDVVASVAVRRVYFARGLAQIRHGVFREQVALLVCK